MPSVRILHLCAQVGDIGVDLFQLAPPEDAGSTAPTLQSEAVSVAPREEEVAVASVIRAARWQESASPGAKVSPLMSEIMRGWPRRDSSTTIACNIKPLCCERNSWIMSSTT